MSPSATPSRLLTAEDVLRLSLPDKQVELVRGRLVVGEPPGTRHGAIAAAGAKLVWVVDPQRSEVRVHRSDGSVALVGRGESLDGEDVLPGFTLPVAELFS